MTPFRRFACASTTVFFLTPMADAGFWRQGLKGATLNLQKCPSHVSPLLCRSQQTSPNSAPTAPIEASAAATPGPVITSPSEEHPLSALPFAEEEQLPSLENAPQAVPAQTQPAERTVTSPQMFSAVILGGTGNWVRTPEGAMLHITVPHDASPHHTFDHASLSTLRLEGTPEGAQESSIPLADLIQQRQGKKTAAWLLFTAKGARFAINIEEVDMALSPEGLVLSMGVTGLPETAPQALTPTLILWGEA